MDKGRFSSLSITLQANDLEPIVGRDGCVFRAADVDLFTLLSKFRFVLDLGNDLRRSDEGRKLILYSPNNEALRQVHNAS